MGSICDITGKKPGFGRNVSHSKHRTNRRFEPNIQRKRIFVPSLGRFVRMDVSTRALRTIDKTGFEQTLKKEGRAVRGVATGGRVWIGRAGD
jgi:large subunit ribosomal protein L28